MDEILPVEAYEKDAERHVPNRVLEARGAVVIAALATFILSGTMASVLTLTAGLALVQVGGGWLARLHLRRRAEQYFFAGGLTLLDSSFEERAAYRMFAYYVAGKLFTPVLFQGILYFNEAEAEAVFVPTRHHVWQWIGRARQPSVIRFNLDRCSLRLALYFLPVGPIARGVAAGAHTKVLEFKNLEGRWQFWCVDPTRAEQRIRELMPAHFT